MISTGMTDIITSAIWATAIVAIVVILCVYASRAQR